MSVLELDVDEKYAKLLMPLKDVAENVHFILLENDEFQIDFIHREKTFYPAPEKIEYLEAFVTWCVDCIKELEVIANRLKNYPGLPNQYDYGVDIKQKGKSSFSHHDRFFDRMSFQIMRLKRLDDNGNSCVVIEKEFFGLSLWKIEKAHNDQIDVACKKCKESMLEEEKRVFAMLQKRCEIFAYFDVFESWMTPFLTVLSKEPLANLHYFDAKKDSKKKQEEKQMKMEKTEKDEKVVIDALYFYKKQRLPLLKKSLASMVTNETIDKLVQAEFDALDPKKKDAFVEKARIYNFVFNSKEPSVMEEMRLEDFLMCARPHLFS